MATKKDKLNAMKFYKELDKSAEKDKEQRKKPKEPEEELDLSDLQMDLIGQIEKWRANGAKWTSGKDGKHELVTSRRWAGADYFHTIIFSFDDPSLLTNPRYIIKYITEGKTEEQETEEQAMMELLIGKKCCTHTEDTRKDACKLKICINMFREYTKMNMTLAL